jgi:hypothetical protein
VGPLRDNAINRVLKAWGLGSIDEPGTLAQMAYLVDGHQHFMTLLRACEPRFRRDMYESMRPHLRFTPKALEDYVVTAKEDAAARELPVLDTAGNLRPYTMPSVSLTDPVEIELWVQCYRCQREAWFYGYREADAIHAMRTFGGWAFDEIGLNHMCPECLDG